MLARDPKKVHHPLVFSTSQNLKKKVGPYWKSLNVVLDKPQEYKPIIISKLYKLIQLWRVGRIIIFQIFSYTCINLRYLAE